MALLIAGILLIQALSFACFMWLARTSVMLVDEEGRPVAKSTSWLERVVPSRQAAPQPKGD